jgi:hypothetical protein
MTDAALWAENSLLVPPRFEWLVGGIGLAVGLVCFVHSQFVHKCKYNFVRVVTEVWCFNVFIAVDIFD